MSSLTLPTITVHQSRGQTSRHSTLSEPQTTEDMLEEEMAVLPGYGYYAQLEWEIEALKKMGAIKQHKEGEA